jgi:hypothetical protein
LAVGEIEHQQNGPVGFEKTEYAKKALAAQ